MREKPHYQSEMPWHEGGANYRPPPPSPPPPAFVDMTKPTEIWLSCKSWFFFGIAWWLFWSVLSERALSSPGWTALFVIVGIYFVIRGVQANDTKGRPMAPYQQLTGWRKAVRLAAAYGVLLPLAIGGSIAMAAFFHLHKNEIRALLTSIYG